MTRPRDQNVFLNLPRRILKKNILKYTIFQNRGGPAWSQCHGEFWDGWGGIFASGNNNLSIVVLTQNNLCMTIPNTKKPMIVNSRFVL